MPREDVVKVFAVRKRRQGKPERELLLALLVKLLHDPLPPRVRNLQRSDHVPEVRALEQELHDELPVLGRRVRDRRRDPTLVRARVDVQARPLRAALMTALMTGPLIDQIAPLNIALARVLVRVHAVDGLVHVLDLGVRGLRALDPLLERLEQPHVLRHVRREDEVGDHVDEPLAVRGRESVEDAHVLVLQELEEQAEVEVLEDALGVLLEERVLGVFEERVVEPEVARVVAEGAQVERHHLDVVERAVGHGLVQAVRRREDVRGVQGAVVRVLDGVQELEALEQSLEAFDRDPEPRDEALLGEDVERDVPKRHPAGFGDG